MAYDRRPLHVGRPPIEKLAMIMCPPAEPCWLPSRVRGAVGRAGQEVERCSGVPDVCVASDVDEPCVGDQACDTCRGPRKAWV